MSVPVNDVQSNHVTYLLFNVWTDSSPGSKQLIMGVAVAKGVTVVRH